MGINILKRIPAERRPSLLSDLPPKSRTRYNVRNWTEVKHGEAGMKKKAHTPTLINDKFQEAKVLRGQN